MSSHNVLQCGVLKTSTRTICPRHSFKLTMAVNYSDCSMMGRRKIRGRKLKLLHRIHNLIDSAAFFFAGPHTPHQVCQPFIARLIAVNEPVSRNHRLARIRNFYSICINFDHHRRAANREILMNQRICDEFSNDDIRNQLVLFPSSTLDDFILGKLSHDELNEVLKSSGISRSFGLIQLRICFRGSVIDHHARRFACNIVKRG